jgi:ATP-binding cassette, subfamily B, multidrug efflux pump
MEAPRDYAVFDAELAGKSFNARLIARLITWVKPHWRQAAISGALVLVASVLAILMPVIVSRVVIDGLLKAHTRVVLPDFGMNAATNWLASVSGAPHLLAACVLYMVATTAWAIAAHYHRVYLAKSVLGALRDLRYDLFSQLETRPASFYDHVAVGRVMTRVTNDVEVLFQLLSGFGVLIGEFVPFLVAFSLMIAIDPALTGILMISVPIVAFATYLFRRGTRTVYRAIRQSISQLNQNLQENLSGIQVVQLNRREDRNLARYTQINQENRREENRAVELETFYGAFIDSLGSAAVGVIIWFGGGHALQQTISLGSVVLFTQFVDMLFRPIVAVGEQYNVLFRAMASAERIFQALDWNERIHEPVRPASLPARLAGAVDVRHLSFAYGNGPRVLKDVSFHIDPGEKLAIVGATGSGKSTIIRLLARFYDFAPGQMFLDNVDLMDIPSAEVRRRIGIVLQDFHVFSGSVADNISLGNPGISRDQVARAAQLVHAHDFVMRLPRGYDEPLMERGQNLSQGQRQLLAFARVLAADPEILVLDEATASIDTETELLIQDALRVLTKGRTSIVIAHRLQTIQEADRVLVLQHGEVKEIGTHEQLLARPGVYRTLYELQFQDTAA